MKYGEGPRLPSWTVSVLVGVCLSCADQRSPTRDADAAGEKAVEASAGGVAGRSSGRAEPVAVAAAELSVTPTCYGAPGLQAQAPWPMVGLCPMHRGQSVAVAAQTNARAGTNWTNGLTLSAGVTFRGSPVVSSDGTIYVGASSGLYRRNADGSAKWTSAATPGAGTGSAPAIGADGTVYYVTTGTASIVRALTPGTTAPTQKWATTSTVFGGTASGSPVLSADGATVYASSQNGKLVALRTAAEGSNAAGSVRWTFRTNATTPSPLWTSPAFGVDGTIYIGANNGLYAVDPATGAQVTSKSYTTGSPMVRSSPAVGPDGTVYFGTGATNTVGLLAVKNGALQWKWPSSGTAPVIMSSPAVGGDGIIYFGTRMITTTPSTPGKVMALTPAGAVKWSFSVGTNNVDASPAIGADGVVYTGADNKNVYALKDNGTATPATVFSFAIGTGTTSLVRSALAIGRNGTVYVPTDDGKLWAFGPGTCGASDTTCDGTDNNCNGSVDEGYVPVATSCGVGACAKTGTSSCVTGVVQQNCTAGTPAASDTTCDNIDDNCNGTKDEGYVPVGTNCGVGACARTGTSSCVTGVVQQNCTAGTPAASDATCDNIDDNCNGTKDEGYVGVTTSCGVGACVRSGTSSCVGGAVQPNCTAGTPAASDTACNGVDDNCNGTKDEGYVPMATSCGIGACAAAGTTLCGNGWVWSNCTPGTPPANDTTCNAASVLPISHNLRLWLKPGSGVTTDANGKVLSWLDESGRGVSVRGFEGDQSDVAMDAPTLVQNAINGQAAVRFDGNDGLRVTNLNGPITPPYSVFIVLTNQGNLDGAFSGSNDSGYALRFLSGGYLELWPGYWAGAGTAAFQPRNGTSIVSALVGQAGPYSTLQAFDNGIQIFPQTANTWAASIVGPR